MRPVQKKQRLTKGASSKENIGPGDFKTYQSGGCVSLESKEDLQAWIEVCNIRYYDHLAVEPNLEESILVIWEDDKGEPPKEKDGKFDIDQMKLLRMEIYWHKEDNKYLKIMSITFHLTGKKNSIVLAGHAAHDWIDFEVPVLKAMMGMKGKGYSKILKKSKTESFANKLTENPRSKGKLTIIDVGEVANAESSQMNDEAKGNKMQGKESEKQPRNENQTNNGESDEEEYDQEEGEKQKDLIKERNALKKRVKELEKKTEMLEIKIIELKEEREIFRKAYRETKKDKDYLEDIIDKIEESEKESISSVQEEEAKRKNPKKQSEHKGRNQEVNSSEEGAKEREKDEEMERLIKHQISLGNALHGSTEARYVTKSEQRIECRYEKIMRGSCKWGDQCRFSHNISPKDQRDEWRKRGYCFQFMNGRCANFYCKYLHPPLNQPKEGRREAPQERWNDRYQYANTTQTRRDETPQENWNQGNTYMNMARFEERQKREEQKVQDINNIELIVKQQIADALSAFKKEITQPGQAQVQYPPRVSWAPDLV